MKMYLAWIKKLIFLTVFGLISMSTVFSCSSSHSVQDKPLREGQKISVTGLIHSYGSAPFIWLGIETEDGKAYALRVDKKTDERLRELFGVTVLIEGMVELPVQYNYEQLKDGAIYVKKIKVVR